LKAVFQLADPERITRCLGKEQQQPEPEKMRDNRTNGIRYDRRELGDVRWGSAEWRMLPSPRNKSKYL
jgi:hypothetical protein